MSRAGSVFEEDLATPGAARHALTLSWQVARRVDNGSASARPAFAPSPSLVVAGSSRGGPTWRDASRWPSPARQRFDVSRISPDVASTAVDAYGRSAHGCERRTRRIPPQMVGHQAPRASLHTVVRASDHEKALGISPPEYREPQRRTVVVASGAHRNQRRAVPRL